MSVCNPRPTTAADPVRDLRAAGFLDGPPPRLAADALADALAYRRYPCGACGRRATAFKPFHRGAQYRALLVCPCGHGEEV
jgi:hypothetical protein